MSKQRKGILSIILSSLGFGTLGLWGKWGYQAGFSPLTLMSVRFILASILLWCILLTLFRKHIRVTVLILARFALQGGVFYATVAIGFFYSLQHLPAAIATIIFYLHPVFTFILASILLKERPAWQSMVSLICVIVGVVFLIGRIHVSGGTNYVWGVLSSMGAGFMYSVFTISNQVWADDIKSVVSTTYTVSFAAITTVLLSKLSPKSLFDLTTPMWLIALGIAVFGTVVGILFYIVSVRSLGASQTAVCSALEPLLGALLAVIFLGERLSLLQILGGALIVTSISWLQWYLVTQEELNLEQLAEHLPLQL